MSLQAHTLQFHAFGKALEKISLEQKKKGTLEVCELHLTRRRGESTDPQRQVPRAWFGVICGVPLRAGR